MSAADALNLWLPAEVSPFVATLLVLLSGVTSFMSSAIGLGGGIAMLAVLASVLTPAIALPVHGVVQIGSNMGRAGMLLEHVRWPFALSFAVGSVLGVAAGTLDPARCRGDPRRVHERPTRSQDYRLRPARFCLRRMVAAAGGNGRLWPRRHLARSQGPESPAGTDRRLGVPTDPVSPRPASAVDVKPKLRLSYPGSVPGRLPPLRLWGLSV